MLIKQLSVFIENKKGRVADITEVLWKSGINIRAISIADTSKYGILRLIVDNTQKALDNLTAAGFTVSVTEGIAIAIPDVPGGLAKALIALNDNDICIEYVYAFIGAVENKAFVMLRVEDNQAAIKVLESCGFAMLKNSDIDV